MFDKHTHVWGGGTQTHHHTATITEKRAPTDESVKLLTEFEKAALDRLLKSVRLKDCQVDCVVHQWRDVLGLDDKYLIRYRVNGKDVKVEHTPKDVWALETTEARREIARQLVDALARSIAVEVLAPAMKQLSTV